MSKDTSSDLLSPPATRTFGSSATTAATTKTWDILASADRCDMLHQGQLFDFGSNAVHGTEPWRLVPNAEQSNLEREGATWSRATGRTIALLFSLDEPQPLSIAARIRGIVSQSAAILIDDKPYATLRFSRNQTRIVLSSGAGPNAVLAGSHKLTLRFAGKAAAGEAFADLDWLRVGPRTDDVASYAAPTQQDVLQNLALGGVPHRTFSLRAPAAVRCPLAVPNGARLRVAVGAQGASEGDAELRILQDGSPPLLLRSVHVAGGDRSPWVDVDQALPELAPGVATLELAAVSAGRGGRIAFGDPHLVFPPPVEHPPLRARAVIVVIVSGLDTTLVPPWSTQRHLPGLEALAHESTVFEDYRAVSTVASAAFASLLTGLMPRQHTVEDPYARLPLSLPTLATLARDASVHTAFFTAHPASFEAFGFARGWEKYAPYSPVSSSLVTAPFEDVATWFHEQESLTSGKLLGLTYARGTHPPYDLSPAEFEKLTPTGYTGPLEPRKAGQVLEKLRRRKKATWTDADRQRFTALYDSALVAVDRGLQELLRTLKQQALWNDTLLVVMGDVGGSADSASVPFAEVRELTETMLHVPLYVHFPQGTFAGTRSKAPCDTLDITKTVLRALDLQTSHDDIDLLALAAQPALGATQPRAATRPGQFATRWGDFFLTGRDDHPPTLCQRSTDPTCEHDLRTTTTLMTSHLWRWTSQQESFWRDTLVKSALAREPATLDADTDAALSVWGR